MANCNGVVLGGTLLLFAGICIAASHSYPYSEATGQSEGQSWGYVRTRRPASQFWWLYYSSHPDGYTNRPLVIWLEGGPGMDGSQFSNFDIFGPIDQAGQPRNATWVQTVSMLYVDSPIGAGFSYYHENATWPDTSDAVSEDLLATLTVFLDLHPEFQVIPIYIFGHSYGGKAAANFAYHLQQASSERRLQCNLKGVGMGNGWVSPTHLISSWPGLLLYMSWVDEQQYATMMERLEEYRELEARGTRDPMMGQIAFGEILSANVYVDTYNVAEQPIYSGYGPSNLAAVKNHLGIIPDDFDSPSYLHGHGPGLRGDDIFRSEVPLLNSLLENSNIEVIVYSGQLDLICSTKGTLDWVNSLTWSRMGEYRSKPRQTLTHPQTGRAEMFVRAHDRLKFYWVLGSGHYVPMDVPETALRLLNRIIDNKDH